MSYTNKNQFFKYFSDEKLDLAELQESLAIVVVTLSNGETFPVLAEAEPDASGCDALAKEEVLFVAWSFEEGRASNDFFLEVRNVSLRVRSNDGPSARSSVRPVISRHEGVT